MKIAVIAPSQIPSRRANSFQVMKMAEAFCNLGHQVWLAVPGSRPQVSWEELALHYGVQSRFSIEWLPARLTMRGYDFSFRAVGWAHRLKVDWIYTRLPQAGALASVLGSKTILEIHDFPQGWIGPWMFRLFLGGRGGRRLVVISQALANDLEKHYRGFLNATEVQIAPDGVDLRRYANLPTQEEARQALAQDNRLGAKITIPVERFTAGYTGHLYPGRGIELILELAKRLPEVLFLLVGGEPNEVTRIQNQVQVQGLRNVSLTGFVPNAELPRFQAACDVLLMPYQQHVAASSGGDIGRYLSPLKLFEYMACCRAIISSDLPVLQEVLNPQNAILLPPSDIEAWIDAIQRLREQPEFRDKLARQARQDASRYSWDGRAASILQGLNAP